MQLIIRNINFLKKGIGKMLKKNFILSLLFLSLILSPCCLYIFQTNQIVKVNESDNEVNRVIPSTPKSSAYAVSEKWNYTTANTVTAVAISADGKFMVIGTEYMTGSGEKYNSLFLRKTKTNETVWVYNTTQKVYSVAISANGKYIAVAAWNYSYLFNNTPSADKKPMWTAINLIPNHRYRTVDISATGDKIVLADYDKGMNGGASGNIYLLDNLFYSGNKINDVLWYNQTKFGDITSVAISGNGEYVVAGISSTAGPCDNVYFWKITGYTLGAEHPPMWGYNTAFPISSVAISYTGDHIVAGSSHDVAGDELFVFNKSADNGNPEWSHSLNSISVTSVAISETTGEYIAVGGDQIVDGGRVYLFNRSNYKGQPMWEYNPGSTTQSVAISADGKYIVAGTRWGIPGVFLFNKSADGVKVPEWSFKDNYFYASVSISSWGNYIAMGGEYASGKAHLFYHARPVPPALLPYIADDDDDDDEEGAIPFGNYYLIFAGIAMVALIVIMKRKAFLKQNK